MTSKILFIIIGVLVLALIVMGVWWKLSSASHREQMIQANNELASLFPLKHINDSLAVRVARVSTDLESEISKTSQLRKIVKEKDQKILFLANVKQESRIDTMRIPVRYRDDFASYFDSTNQWFTISGWYDSALVSIQAIETRDSLTVAITQAKNDILYGYVQNHSPYTTILNANFAIDASQFMDKPSPWWKYAAIAGWSAILIHSLFTFLSK